MSHWMRRCACLLLLAVALPAARAAVSPAAISREIARLEQDFNDAYGANDLPRYFGYYAIDLVAVFPEGRTSLADYRKSWTAFIAAGNRLESAELSDLVIRVAAAGDAAVASYQLAVRTHLADGTVSDERFFETDVWLKRGGAWQVAHVHYSPLPTPPAAH
jgi:ketosteroid isomerase-like protein